MTLFTWRAKDLGTWHRWFAWRPVFIGDSLVWFEWTERRLAGAIFVPAWPPLIACDWERRRSTTNC